MSCPGAPSATQRTSTPSTFPPVAPANNTVVYGGGTLDVLSGGTISNTGVYGTVNVSSGGTAIATIVTFGGGTLKRLVRGHHQQHNGLRHRQRFLPRRRDRHCRERRRRRARGER